MKHILLILLAIISFNSYSEPSQELIDAAERHLVLTEAQWAHDEGIKQVQNHFMKSFNQKGNSEMSDEEIAMREKHKQEAIELILDNVSWEKIQPVIVKMLAESYSLQDLQAINEFYASDAGRALVRKTPEITKKQFQFTQSLTQNMMSNVSKLMKKQRQELKALNQ